MKSAIASSDITFVIQGPIFPEITRQSVQAVRELFPESPIIVSTWEGSDVGGLSANQIIFNEDPGTTIVGYKRDNSPICININRQLRNTLNGLKAVKTMYAVKLRSDNILGDTKFVSEFLSYPERESKYSLFKQRIVTTTFYAKEQTKGISIPYFVSDFFHFGLTEDLLALWDIPEFQTYQYNEKLRGQRQHWQSPYRLIHTEQAMWVGFLAKYHNVYLNDEYGRECDIADSYQFIVNNLIMLDNSQSLNLKVQKRLEQPNPFPYEFYSQERWKWLYEQQFGTSLNVSLTFKLKWYLARVYKFLHKGIGNMLKTYFIRLRLREKLN
ncbi:WavE lipopolysaccharide synthesis family protein [Vibrio mediterranei]|uniref:WavE lipopolysaccharide synthesis family protein n=1 Tax=Vibrio mediterranei TaxID=689 RepID=UPI002283CB40|nr:WavE lipopolysaccharide synthesis family protein [Vibrio mediterranei]MCY9853623.1 wavE lipopolysaccharide synthesis family protein [Vibrio mediterranei]